MSNHSVMLYGEVRGKGEIDPVILELLGAGRKLAADLGTELAALLIGDRLAGIAEEAASFGFDKVYKVEGSLFKDFKADLRVDALKKLCVELNPNPDKRDKYLHEIIFCHSFQYPLEG